MRQLAFARRTLATLIVILLAATSALAAQQRIQFTQETLPNGLRVIYAPLHQAPVIHVRVLYHVGSKDERPDRQGFAHMFEHMMFRGSAHVKPQEHMKLLATVGGMPNAFTSFDETVYVNTIPANQLDLALYLESDRMASFKVSDEIYRTERHVVAEEWGRRQNTPYGTMYEDFLKVAYTTHSYRWPTIGNMQHLQAASASELQEFFNRYYIPNNAVLVIAGDFDESTAKALVKRYFAWIPRGADVVRNIPAEPPQTEPRRTEVKRAVRQPALLIGYHIPPYKSDDQYALALLSNILGGGESSRLQRLLVSGENPLCTSAYSGHLPLEDGGWFGAGARVLIGKDPAQVEKIITTAVADAIEKGVTREELDKAKTQVRVATIRELQTADRIAGDLGNEALLADDPNRVNTDLERTNAVTVQDVQAVARKYLRPANSTTLVMLPDAAAFLGRGPASAPADVAVAPSTKPVEPRKVEFPNDYPATPPLNTGVIKPTFNKGTDLEVKGVKVVVLPDSRLPLVNWTLTLRQGSHAAPAGKEGIGALTAAMLRRGAADLSYAQLSEDLESRGITISVADGGDVTNLSGSCLTEQLDHAIRRFTEIAFTPTFPQAEFDKLKQKTLSELRQSRENPETVAHQELDRAIFGDSPLGRTSTVESVNGLTLDDLRGWYERIRNATDAIFIISGDITVERGTELAKKVLAGIPSAPIEKVQYNLPDAGKKLRIVLVDRPDGQQSTIRMAIRAYDIRNDDKFAGSVTDRLLGHGIESRLGRAVRAEKGYAYSVWGMFSPTRHAGEFMAGAETSFKTTADAIEAMFKVFHDLQAADVPAVELADNKMRLTGSMVMGMQTIQQQANYRLMGILNGYPIDYYDKYPARINAVNAAQVRQIAKQYIRPDAMTVVVVAPATAVQQQLSRLGSVEVVPMPGRRGTSQPASAPALKAAMKE